MSKAQASRAKPRYNPLHTKPPQTLTPGPSLLFISYNPHAQVKKRDLEHPRRRDVVEAIGNQPLGIEPLHGMQWLYQQSAGFQADFWQRFFPPVGTTARSKNPWPPFKSLATTVLEQHGWDSFLTASEIWQVIRRERPDIKRSWFNVVNAVDADNTVHPAAPLERKRRRRSNYQGVMQAQLPMAPLSNAGHLSPLWAWTPQTLTVGAYPASADLGPSYSVQRPVSQGGLGWAPSGSGEYEYLHHSNSSSALSTSSSPIYCSNCLAPEEVLQNSAHLPEVPRRLNSNNVQLPMASTSSAGTVIPASAPHGHPKLGPYLTSAYVAPLYNDISPIVSQPQAQRPVSQIGQAWAPSRSGSYLHQPGFSPPPFNHFAPPTAPNNLSHSLEEPSPNFIDIWDGSPHQNQPNLGHQGYNFDPGYCSIEPNARPTAYPSPSEFSATSLLVPDQLSYPYVDHSEVEFNLADLLEAPPQTDSSRSLNKSLDLDSNLNAEDRILMAEFRACFPEVHIRPVGLWSAN